MRPLNLTPPEDRRGDSAPLRAGVLSYVVVGVLAAALIAVVTLVLTSNSINESKSELASLQARQVAAQQAAASLAPYDEFATLSASRNQTVAELARSRFDWERVLQELALVIPSDVTLESVTATATADTGAAAPVATEGAITGPSLEISGCAKGQEGTAGFLASLRDIDGVTRVGMQSSTLADAESGPDAATGETACSSKGAAKFQITVAFDAVPTTAPATDTGVVPATTETTPEATPAPATDAGAAPVATETDGGVAATEGEQQGAADSANDQTREAGNAAGAVGAGDE